MHIIFVAAQDRKLLAGGHFPQTHGFIQASRGQQAAVGGKGDRLHRTFVAAQDGHITRREAAPYRQEPLPGFQLHCIRKGCFSD
ncbi:MAG: hypothetical protein DDT33_01106 [Firmicutes bacterium]|nr:hypothetical protein [Bacillota bacterium]